MDHWRRARLTVRQRVTPFVKTGTVASQDLLNDRIFLTTHTLAGYIDIADGRRLAFSPFRNHASVEDIEGVVEVRQLGDLAALIQ